MEPGANVESEWVSIKSQDLCFGGRVSIRGEKICLERTNES
jgi:hypothetical protein